jgi:hypothetical protein
MTLPVESERKSNRRIGRGAMFGVEAAVEDGGHHDTPIESETVPYHCYRRIWLLRDDWEAEQLPDIKRPCRDEFLARRNDDVG